MAVFKSVVPCGSLWFSFSCLQPWSVPYCSGINSYEVARRRIPVSALPTLAQMLSISIDELLGEATKSKKSKRGPASKLQQQIEQIRQLPRTQQTFVSQMLEAVIQKAG